MHTDATEEEQREEKLRRLALRITVALLPIILGEDDPPVPQHTSILSGNLYYQETMQNPNVHNFSRRAASEGEGSV